MEDGDFEEAKTEFSLSDGPLTIPAEYCYQLLVWTLWFLLKLRLCYHDADTQGNSRRISCWKPTKGQGMYRYLARSSIEIAKIRMQFGAPIGLCNMGIFFYAYWLQKISREG
ncbi:hypothetical protein L1987_14417 [Smallanthus sonchifolius]|uniref:Uncharacterized protein n=1 Tax=Smallanthus sonchifolius TaxID=185202 RepID=A0ACB9J512_9ASTR|nr:hypothetical protein L1987_14417 [Smallanthus sonchifolius]